MWCRLIFLQCGAETIDGGVAVEEKRERAVRNGRPTGNCQDRCARQLFQKRANVMLHVIRVDERRSLLGQHGDEVRAS